eukprot:Gb_01433 [translate_table: standard]
MLKGGVGKLEQVWTVVYSIVIHVVIGIATIVISIPMASITFVTIDTFRVIARGCHAKHSIIVAECFSNVVAMDNLVYNKFLCTLKGVRRRFNVMLGIGSSTSPLVSFLVESLSGCSLSFENNFLMTVVWISKTKRHPFAITLG